ncbi:MAG TPA: DNA integrity scanning protein DisA nucleotide-binding domain protein [Isosphaeraceae bacterium]|nr:DNA integrity scanning protein DisA nucleotide-binding domain protein [Isosphaeraceae bacterium]
MTPPPHAASNATTNLLALAFEGAPRLGVKALLILPEGPMDWENLRGPAAAAVRTLVAVTSDRQRDAVRDAGLTPVEVEATDAAITERISLALIEAVATDLLTAGDRVTVVYSGFEAETLDSMTVVRLGEHLERLSSRDLRALETSVPFETLKAVVDVAVEIGREGREGKNVGTLVVVGDVRNVLNRSRTLGFDPFKGYRRKERNLRDVRVREAIKEIAQMDGAFVVARDGTVEAACRIIDAPNTGLTLPKGLGTRHWAAAAITNVSNALAVVVSQSTGTVRLFQNGEIILRIAPMRHYRAMKWHDTETEHPPARPEKESSR